MAARRWRRRWRLALGYGVTVVDHFVREQRERRRLAQFFSPEVLREVVRHRHEHSLGSSRRLLTVLFADIRGFTALSEKLEPEEVAAMLREYLTEMTEVIFKHGGTVDKYMGDCIMALYNAPFEDPQHAGNARADRARATGTDAGGVLALGGPAGGRPSVPASASTPARRWWARWGPSSASNTPPSATPSISARDSSP